VSHLRVHDLKCDLDLLRSVAVGRKRFEIRRNDRGFFTFDRLLLRGFDRATQEYNGEWVWVLVDYILPEYDGLEPGYVVMSITKIAVGTNEDEWRSYPSIVNNILQVPS